VKNKKLIFGVIFILGICSCIWANIDTLTAELYPYEVEEDDISGWCSLGCAVWWILESSSHLQSQGDNKYDVNQIDGLIKTAWVEGVDGPGIGEYIVFYFPDSSEYFPMDSINLEGFRVVNGYCKDEKIWEQNSRVKMIKLYLNNEPIYYVKFQDSMKLQDFGFKTIWLHHEDKIKIEIVDVFPGSKYTDTAISVLEPLGAH
jgi:hypothetical protein